MSSRSLPIVVRRSRIQGSGAFAARPIKKGERIIEYLGERISNKESQRRDANAGTGKAHHTFMFEVSERVTIDAGVGGNEARFINHSCDANAYSENARGRIFIIAKRAIEPGEEVTYDYWYTVDGDESLEALKRDYPCRCGKEKCRKTLARIPRKALLAAKAAAAAKGQKPAKKASMKKVSSKKTPSKKTSSRPKKAKKSQS